MEKQKENQFLAKFSLLNSQEYTDDINWTSSCSSEYEDKSLHDTSMNRVHKTRATKRKRMKKVPKNISNLSFTLADTSKENITVVVEDKSPILISKVRQESASVSPILQSSKSFPRVPPASSPILSSKTNRLRSPILVMKTESPKITAKVRKKLFKNQHLYHNVNSENQNVYCNQDNFCDTFIKKEEVFKDSEINDSPIINIEDNNENQQTEKTLQTKTDLVKRVKSFFDSHFSQNSLTESQNSISDISTPKNSTKTSEEIEIFTCKSQVLSNNNSVKSLKEDSIHSSESSIYNFNKSAKKIRYKKDGHAYRLNSLLKKQNASLALWQHERYLAENSNFVIPKGEFTVFRIQKVHCKYGCHLIECVDVDDVKYLILINSSYVVENIVSETILKLYEPYLTVEYSSDCKLVINVTKYECSNF